MTLIFCLGNSIKKLKKLVNTDLEHLVNWLNANKFPLILKKTVILKSKQKKLEGNLKINLCGKKDCILLQTLKYRSAKIDKK